MAKTFGKNTAEKGKELVKNILTPADKASFGDTEQIVKSVINDQEVVKVLQYIGTIFYDGKKMQGNNVAAMLNNISNAGSNVLTKINANATQISKSVSSISQLLSTSLKTQEDYYKQSMGSDNGSTGEISLLIDTTKAANYDKILEAISKLNKKKKKNMLDMFDAANKISYIDLSALEQNFITPLSKFNDLQYQEIIAKISAMQESDIFGSLKEFMTTLNELPEVDGRIQNSYAALDNFVASMVKMMAVDISELNDITDKFDIMSVILSNDESNNLKDILKELSEIDYVVGDDVIKSIQSLAIALGTIAQITEVTDDKSTKEIIKSIDNSSKIVNKIKGMPEFTAEDAKRIDESSVELKNVMASYSANNVQMYDQLEKTAAKSDKAKGSINKIFGANSDIVAKTEEMREEADDMKKKKASASIDNLGDVILKVGAVMLIGTWMLTKDPNMLKNTLKFGAALAAFTVMTVTPLVIIAGLGGILNASGENINSMSNSILKLTAAMLVAALIYKNFGGEELSNAARLYIEDMTKFVLGVGLVFTLVTLFATEDKAAMINAFGNTVLKLSLIMLIGAWFMMNDGGKKAKAALAFGVLLTAFIFLLSLPIKFLVRGGLFSSGIAAIKEVGTFIVTCTIIMLVGALFMYFGGGKYAIAALAFGVLLAAFIMLMIIPLKLITGGVFSGLTTQMCINQLNDFVKTSAIILMVGGLFMAIGNGKLAAGAIKFAVLMAAFVLAITLSFKILLTGSSIAMVRAIKRFKQAVETIALVLMVGGLLMLVPGFGKNVLAFALLMSTFTLAMALIFIVVGKAIGRAGIKRILLFTLAVVLLIEVVTFCVLALRKVSWKEFLKSIGFLAIAVAAMAIIMGIIGSPFLSKFIRKGAINLLLMSATMLLLSLTIAIIAWAASKMKLKDLLFMMLAVGCIVAIFAIIGIPYVAMIVGLGALVMLGVSIAMLLMSFVFVMIHFLVNKFDLVADMQKLTQAVLALQPLFIIISLLLIPIVLASVALIFMGVSLVTLTVGLLLVHVAALFDTKKDVEKIIEGLHALTDMYLELGLMFVPMVLGAVAATLIGASLTTLGIGFTVLHLISLFDAVADAEKVSEALKALMGVYTLLGILFPLIVFGSVAATTLGASLTVLALGFGLVHVCCSKLEIEEIELINDALNTLKWTFTFLGILMPFILVGSIAGTTMAATLTVLSGAFYLVHVVASQEGLENDIDTIDAAIKKVRDVFWYMLKHSISIVGGGAIATLMSAALLFVGISFALIHKIVSTAPNLDSEIETFGDNLVNICKVFTEKMDEIDFKKLLFTTWKVKYTMRPIIHLASELFETIKDFATLMIPNKWHKETGVAIGWRQLKSDDFEEAAKSITKVFTTLICGISDLAQNPSIADIMKDFQESGESGGFLARLFSRGKSKFSTIVRMSSMVIRLVGEAGDAMANVAALMIPIKWNKDGVAIKYRTLTTSDFETAAQGVRQIMTTLIDAIASIGETHGDLIEDFLDEGSDSIFTGIMGMGKGIGEMLGGMSEAIASYASLKIPIKWDSKGKPIKFRNISPQDFKDAASNVDLILGTLVNAVKRAYEKWFGQSTSEGSKGTGFLGLGKSKAQKNAESAAAQNDAMGKIVATISNVVGLVSSIAQTISDISNLRIPIYKGTSLQPVGYRSIEKSDFDNLAKIVEQVIAAFPKALTDGWRGGGFISKSTMKDIVDSLMPMTDILKNIVECMQGYASMNKIPILDKDGKVDHYEDFDYDKVLGTMGTNVEKIITGMARGIRNGYWAFKIGGLGDPEMLGEIIDAIAPMGDFLKSLVDTMIAYSNLRIPKYNKKGEISGYYDLINNQAEFEMLFAKIESNINMILTGMINGTKSALRKYLDENGTKELEQISDAAQQVMQIIEPINNIVEMVKKYAELKFPNGELDKDGKPKNGYTSIQNMDFSNLQTTITNMISALPVAIYNAITSTSTYMETLFGEDENLSLSNFTNHIVEIGDTMKQIYPMIEGFANLKIPVKFDKDRKPTKYMELKKSEFDNLSINIQAMLECIPKAIVNVLEKIDFSYSNIMELKNFIRMVDDAENLLLTLYSDENIKKLRGCSINSVMFGISIGNIATSIGKMKTILVENIFTDLIFLMYFIESAFSDTGLFNYDRRKNILDTVNSVMNQFSALIDICTMNENSPELNSNSFFRRSKNENSQLKDNIKKMLLLQQLVSVVQDSANLLLLTNTILDPITVSPFVRMNKVITQIVESPAKDITKRYLRKFELLETITNPLTVSALHLNRINKYMKSTSLYEFVKFNDIMKYIMESSVFTINFDDNLTEKFEHFDYVTFVIARASLNLSLADKRISSVHEESFEKIKDIINDINTSMMFTSDESIDKLERETEAISKYVKSINSIQVQKLNSLTNLFKTITYFSRSVGDLNEFTQTLANEVSTALVDLTEQINEAKTVINTAEKQRDKRQIALDKSIEKIEKLMSKPLNVNVSSGGDKLNAAYENPSD